MHLIWSRLDRSVNFMTTFNDHSLGFGCAFECNWNSTRIIYILLDAYWFGFSSSFACFCVSSSFQVFEVIKKISHFTFLIKVKPIQTEQQLFLFAVVFCLIEYTSIVSLLITGVCISNYSTNWVKFSHSKMSYVYF